MNSCNKNIKKIDDATNMGNSIDNFNKCLYEIFSAYLKAMTKSILI